MDSFPALVRYLREIRHYASALSLLSWDQETFMPEQAGPARADQMGALSGLVHEHLSGRALRKALDRLNGRVISADRRVILSETRRHHVRASRLPKPHVVEVARLSSEAQQVWIRARQKSDFSIVRPYLESLVRLKRRECEWIGYATHPYDALLDEYEPHVTTADLARLFGELKRPLSDILRSIRHAGVFYGGAASPRPRGWRFDEARQSEFCEHLLKRMGFDFRRGRMDRSAHPFTASFHPTDVRLTTRFDKSNPFSGIFSTLHEGGHALYDQGLDPKTWGTPLSEGVSYGIHESQARLWENSVGRSLPFWSHFLPQLRKRFPGPLGRMGLDRFYVLINRVRPSCIRVDADEVTYNLHIILRFELEKALIGGEMRVRDIPSAWNDGMSTLLGVRPRNDAEGCLQDVHWYFGLFGYFPCYTLGNLYAAQLFSAYQKLHPRWRLEIQGGRLEGLKRWLNRTIHRPGSRHPAGELCRRVTGESLSPKWFLRYLETKYIDRTW